MLSVSGGKACEVTPSGWRPGKTTLNPGVGLVGKVWEKWDVTEAFDQKRR